MSEKFKDWKYAIEIDYLSLYIKTWFAFLDTLKQIYPDIKSKNGDHSLINKYSQNFNLSSLSNDKWIQENVKKIINDGKICVLKELPNEYFKNFYITNKNFSFKQDHLNQYKILTEIEIKYASQIDKKINLMFM